ncbi:site-specific integrase [Exiguobacterium sp.]|uniref:tyrosine-type recombinase/integrase n=1 Tax=Exiguobacterium sp. TaxID=44751 RepID=UPI0028AB4D6A|nr:site-specific integrase [Exiguobacterium sp.]
MTYYQERLLAIIEQADYSHLTKKAYRSDVRHLCRHVERIDLPSLQRYGKFLRDTYAPATVARCLHALSILFDHLVAERSLQTNPLARVKKPVPAPHRRLTFTYDDVHRVIETIRPDATPLFCEDSGRPVNPAKFRRFLKEASEHCLGRIIRPHDIRVTFATTLYHVHQTDILTIMRLLGHSDVRTTQHYVLPSHDIAHTSVNRLKRTDD